MRARGRDSHSFYLGQQVTALKYDLAVQQERVGKLLEALEDIATYGHMASTVRAEEALTADRAGPTITVYDERRPGRGSSLGFAADQADIINRTGA